VYLHQAHRPDVAGNSRSRVGPKRVSTLKSTADPSEDLDLSPGPLFGAELTIYSSHMHVYFKLYHGSQHIWAAKRVYSNLRKDLEVRHSFAGWHELMLRMQASEDVGRATASFKLLLRGHRSGGNPSQQNAANQDQKATTRPRYREDPFRPSNSLAGRRPRFETYARVS
jgi:hypothetical protein